MLYTIFYMRNKFFISLVSLVSLFFIAYSASYAGGCCFESVTVLSNGTAGTQAALIEGRLLNVKYVMDQQEPKYQANQIILPLNQDSPAIKCRAAITDIAGHFTMECHSSQAGSFDIQVKPLSANDEAGQATPIKVQFAESNQQQPALLPLPTATPIPTFIPLPSVPPMDNTLIPTPQVTPTASPTATPDAETLQKITDLEAKVDQQETKITFLESVVVSIQSWTKTFFSFTSGEQS